MSRFGAPLIVVSFGTATVFIAISAAGEYLGVAIAPGIRFDRRADRQDRKAAADRPRVAGARHRTKTNEALQSGIVYGFAGQTEALVARMRAEMGGAAKVVATGGLAQIVAKQTPVVDAVDPHLSLVGLELFHRKV